MRALYPIQSLPSMGCLLGSPARADRPSAPCLRLRTNGYLARISSIRRLVQTNPVADDVEFRLDLRIEFPLMVRIGEYRQEAAPFGIPGLRKPPDVLEVVETDAGCGRTCPMARCAEGAEQRLNISSVVVASNCREFPARPVEMIEAGGIGDPLIQGDQIGSPTIPHLMGSEDEPVGGGESKGPLPRRRDVEGGRHRGWVHGAAEDHLDGGIGVVEGAAGRTELGNLKEVGPRCGGGRAHGFCGLSLPRR